MKIFRVLLIGLFLATYLFAGGNPAQAVPAAAPAAFQKVAPAQGAANLPYASVTLSWTASETPGVTYEVCVWTSLNCPKPKWRSAGSLLTLTVTNLSPNKTYFWQVRAYDATGSTDADGGAWWTFNTNLAAPTDFFKSTPANLDTNLVLDPLLTWTSSPNATSYEYCVDTTPDNLCDGNIWLLAGNTTSVHLAGLQYETDYYWQVRARNAIGVTEADTGSWFKFTTLIQPAADFVKISPTPGSIGQPLEMYLSWSPSLGADGYDYCLEPTSPTPCADPTDWMPAGTSLSVGPLTLAYGVEYYWQVRSRNSLGDFTYANEGLGWTFATLNSAPLDFSKIIPTDTTTNQPLNPWLVWSTSEYALNYQYCIQTSPACPTEGDWQPMGLNTSTQLSGLLPGTTYYWQVRATNDDVNYVYANGETEWWEFSTIPVPPSSSSQSFTMDEDASLDEMLAYTNPGGGTVTFSLYGARPAGNFFLYSTGQLTYTPPQDYSGTVHFQFRISDGINPPVGPYTVTITVSPVNDAPVMDAIPNWSTPTGSTLTFFVTATDPDLPYGDTLAYSIVGTYPYFPTIDAVSGQFDWTPLWDPAHPGAYLFTISVTDGEASASRTTNITVTPLKMRLPVIRR